jgi:hypothetical protein
MTKNVNKKDLPKAPIENDFGAEAVASREFKQEKISFIEKLKKEPRRKIVGHEIFKSQMGTVYSFLYNGYPVTIRFDGTEQEFPESIANAIERKLLAVSRANTPKEINEPLRGF